MSNSKKLMVAPSKVQRNLDDKEKKSIKRYEKNSKFIKRSLIVYIKGKKSLSKTEELKNGYLQMAKINLDICEMGFAEDMVVLREYEANLAESDLPDDNDSETRRYILC